jgi:hypothetical protein
VGTFYARCDYCGGVVEVQGPSKVATFALLPVLGLLAGGIGWRGGKCRDCGGTYSGNEVKLLKYITMPKLPRTASVVQQPPSGRVNSRTMTAALCSCGHQHFLAAGSASQICSGACAPHGYKQA